MELIITGLIGFFIAKKDWKALKIIGLILATVAVCFAREIFIGIVFICMGLGWIH